eukprot:CCRYP_012568-RA/>CCRYP_012568-RA protein AED:0.40 eAED:0.39 QI:0/0/0/1/0/0/3/0/484
MEWNAASVQRIDKTTVVLICQQKNAFREPSEEDGSTWGEILHRYGGTWMWRDLETVRSEEKIFSAIRAGTALWVTDGSYDHQQSPNISGVGWFIYAAGGENYVQGSFHEENNTASLYSAELLGLTALHLVALTMEKFQAHSGKLGTLCCDNEKSLYRATYLRQRIPPGNIKQQLTGTFSYEHIYGHADRDKTWAQLSLRERLNCACNLHAKQAQVIGAVAPRSRTHETLPMEISALHLDRQKITGDIASPLRYWFGYRDVQNFYTKELGWMQQQFNAVDWDSLARVIARKAKMYQLWLTKQVSKFSGTQLQLARIPGDADSSCPNCGMPEEQTSHLNKCRSPGRTQQFQESLAQNQDLIGWMHFLEEKISKSFVQMQRSYLLGVDTTLTGDDWDGGFISNLLKISHTQWINRNVTLHDKERGYLTIQRRCLLVREIHALHDSNPASLPISSRFLLDLDVTTVEADGNTGRKGGGYTPKTKGTML